MKRLAALSKSQTIKTSYPLLGYIAFTLPLPSVSVRRVHSRIEKTFQNRLFSFVRAESDNQNYDSKVMLCNDDKIIATFFYSVDASHSCEGVLIECNPIRLLDDQLLAVAMKYLLGREFSLLWDEANITELDVSFDIHGCTPDQVVAYSDGEDAMELSFDGKSNIVQQVYGTKQSDQYLKVYKKSTAGEWVTGIELRMKVSQLPCFKDELVSGLKNVCNIIKSNPFSGMKVLSSRFLVDKRFEPGFAHCILVRGLIGALSSYHSHDSRLAEKYFNILNEDYRMDIYSPVGLWMDADYCDDYFGMFNTASS